jgi:hypothetical protein
MRHSDHPSRLRALLAAGATVASLGLVPAAARAASVSEGGGTLAYAAAAGEANHVTIAPWGLTLKVTETGTKAGKAIALTVGPGCWRLSPSSATCAKPAAGVTFDGADGNDYLDASLLTTAVSASGGPGDDTLSTGSGADTLDGGTGNDVLSSGGGGDVLEANDGSPDTLSCGDGADSGNADSGDAIAADCETVLPPQATVDPGTTDPGTTDPGTTDPGTADPGTDPGDPTTPAGNAVPPTIPPQTVGVSASGVASVLVVCPADSGGCSGTVTIELPLAAGPKHAKVASVGHGGATLKIGQTKFTAAAGSSKTVPVRLSKRGRQRILRGRHSTRARITVTTRSAAGVKTVTSQDVTLRPRPRGGPKVRRP